MFGLSHTYIIYDFVINDNAPNVKYHNLVAYVGSAVYVLVSACSNPISDCCEYNIHFTIQKNNSYRSLPRVQVMKPMTIAGCRWLEE